jgi:hypothetical protein
VKKYLLLPLFLSVFWFAPLAQAEEGAAICDSQQAIVDRAWMLYAAKNPVAEDEQSTIGARILAFSTLNLHCAERDSAAKPAIDLSRPSATQLETLKSFRPKGPMAALAECLYESTPTDSSRFVLASDAAAFANYRANGRMGAIDEAAFKKMLSSSKGCGNLVEPKVQANELYADLNWHVRIQPNIERIVVWFADGEMK